MAFNPLQAIISLFTPSSPEEYKQVKQPKGSTHTMKIVSGPGTTALQENLKGGQGRSHLSFTVDAKTLRQQNSSDYPFVEKKGRINFHVVKMEREDGSGHSWNLTVRTNTKHELEVYYHSQGRYGSIRIE